MTSPHHDQTEDAAFDDFLEGRGELVKQLKALSQLTPSAALDAAILASAKAAVAQAERSKENAANDPVSPSKPGFLTRFRIPLAMAASLMVAVLVAVQWHAQPEYQAAVQVAQAPVAEPAPATAAPQTEQAGTNAKADSSVAAPMVAATRQSIPMAESKAIAVDKKTAPQVQAAANAMAAQDALKSAKERSNPVPAQLAQADAAQMRSKSATMQDEKAAAAPAASPASAPSYASAAGANVAARAAAIAAPPAPAAATAPPAESLEKQKAWLARIEEMIKTDSRKEEALAEWAKFEKAYPDYSVPEKLKAQIKALKN
jgi:hypothetical protein